MSMRRVGSWWLPKHESHMDVFLTKHDTYQYAQRDAALKFVKDWRLAIDIGAHVGLWTRDLVKRFTRVVAFEPVTAHRHCFTHNVPMRTVDLYSCALGAQSGKAMMKVERENSGHTRIAEGGTYEVEVRTLDSFTFKFVDFIKIDVEGYELDVLRGGEQTLSTHRPVVVIEQKPHNGEKDRYAASDFLLSLNYELAGRVIDDLTFVPK